jgi:Derlin-2/3
MSSPEQWFKALPVVTKYYFVTAVATTCLTSLGVISPALLFLDFDKVFYKFEIWRLVTCFIFFGKFGLPFVFQIYILVRYMQYLEDGYYQGLRGTADLCWMMTFGAAFMILIAYFWPGLYFLGPAMVFMAMYVWSRKDPYGQVNVWGFAFQKWQLPFVMLLFAVIIGGNFMLDIVGIVVGHLYHFLLDVVPTVYGKTVFWTPSFVYHLFETRSIAPPTQGWQRTGGHRLDR